MNMNITMKTSELAAMQIILDNILAATVSGKKVSIEEIMLAGNYVSEAYTVHVIKLDDMLTMSIFVDEHFAVDIMDMYGETIQDGLVILGSVKMLLKSFKLRFEALANKWKDRVTDPSMIKKERES